MEDSKYGLSSGIPIGGIPEGSLHENIKSVYREKQSVRVWNQHLVVNLLEDLGFTRSTVDKCVF